MPETTTKWHKNIRLKNYNYSQPGYYFITLCTENRKNLLCSIILSNNTSGTTPYKMILTEEGIIIDKYINSINTVYDNVKIDYYVIMPNHIHLLIILNTDSAMKLPNIINSYKTIITKKLGTSIWQKNYYEHIVRNEQELLDVRSYIESNPLKWSEDKYYTE